MKPQGHRTIQHGQIADTPGSAIFDPLAGSLAAGTNEVRVAALEMQFQLVGSDDLVGHAEFWQFEPGLDTLKIHASGSSCGVMGFSRILRGIRHGSISTRVSLFSIRCANLNLGEEPEIIDQVANEVRLTEEFENTVKNKSNK